MHIMNTTGDRIYKQSPSPRIGNDYQRRSFIYLNNTYAKKEMQTCTQRNEQFI